MLKTKPRNKAKDWEMSKNGIALSFMVPKVLQGGGVCTYSDDGLYCKEGYLRRKT